MTKSILPFLCGVLLVCACASTPSDLGSEEVALAVIADLDRGDTQSAEERVAGANGADEVFLAVYQTANRRYANGDPAGAADLLRFLRAQYPESRSAREALLYSLFLTRIQQSRPREDLVRETEAVARELRESHGHEPIWLDLVDAQVAIDTSDIGRAQRSMNRFRERWDGTPETLSPYVEDIERYLDSH